MKNFNLHRFVHVLNYTFATGRRNLLFSVVGMLLAYLLLFIVSNFNRQSCLPETKSIVDQAIGMSLVCSLFFIMAGAGTLFSSETSKQGRAALLMLPASDVEKFLGRWVYLLVFTLAGLFMFVVADGLHYLYHWAQGHEAISAVGCLLRLGDVHYISDRQEEMEHLVNVDIYLFFVALHAFFLLGSTLVRRYAVIVTALVVVLCFVVYFWLFENYISSLPKEVVLWGFFWVNIVCIVLFTGLAYRAFCRWQLITRKFLSL